LSIFRFIYAWLLFLLGLTFVSTAQKSNAFVSITEPLVNNEVTSIIQDKKGFIWIGTRGGLHRFDGYEMKLLKYDYGNNTNLLSQSIEVLHNGKKNNVWIGTKSGGLSEYNLESGIIRNYPQNNQNIGEFNADYILSILDTDSEKLFVGTWKGFQYLDKTTGKFNILNTTLKTFDIQSDDAGGYWLATDKGLRHLTSALQNDYSINFGKEGINITSIVKDKSANCLWLGTWDNGLYRYDLSTKSFKNYRLDKQNPTSLTSNNTYRIFLDSKNQLWVGTWGGGLNIFNTSRDAFQKVELNIPGLYTNDNQIILSIQEDPSGLLWIGTDGTGIFKFDLNQKKFHNIGYDIKTNALVTSSHIYSVYVDPFNKLWLGTKSGNIQYSSDWINYKNVNSNLIDKSTPSKHPWETRAFLQIDNYLWIGTIKGMFRIKNMGKNAGVIESFYENTKLGNYFKNKKIHTIVKASDGKIWIGTQEHGVVCITNLNGQEPSFKLYAPAANVKGALQNERAISIIEDSKKRIWVGTYKGLHLYNPAKDDFEVFTQNNQLQHSISNNTIHSLAEDKNGNIWAASQSGLNMIYDYKDGKIFVTTFTSKNGLPSDYVNAVIADNNGYIWASTNKGIIRLNPQTKRFTVFDKREGIQSNVFVEDAQYKDKKGNCFFGGAEGLTYFHPDSIIINRFTPPIYFTNLSINNKPYEFGRSEDDSTILIKPFYETKEITLNHLENIFSIEFAALDFHSPDKNEYMYILEGFNKDWVYAGKNRLVAFTNLKYGTYTLKVKATNSDKIWNDTPLELKINILPPPWKTWWAYTLYIVAFIFLLWLTRHIGLRQVALQNQLMFTNMARKQENELSDFKSRLFTNLSHEFRTPLTLILGPLDDLLQRKNLETSVVKSLRLIQKQSKRMLRMVNQLLDFQKAEVGSLKLTPQQGEIVSFCSEIYALFTDEATRRGITYHFLSKEKYISFTFDQNKLEIIVFNILANAFKFTPNNGAITLSVTKDEHQNCIITVEDTGMGIPTGELELIFDRFYRGKDTNATNISGTGIGLSFVKELTLLHGGTINAFSDGKSGSIFTVSLPPIVKSETGLVIQGNALAPLNLTIENFNSDTMMEENESVNQEQEQPIILLVEDESDMLQYVYETLSPSYKVVTATNGREGVEKAFETIPDLIVSDVMMPEMDGIELCRKLKSDKDTSHIPIILLTALSDMNHHVEGIREGADVYLPKPFNSQLLLVHIHNLINSRNTLKELYAKKIFLGSSNFEIETYEEEFLYKLMKVVEENISNFNFNNDELASHMFMSKSTFYRKLKAITGMSGNEFIRTARLNYAAKMLESGKYSVTEAAFESGFNDIKYFRKRFQERFKVTPSEYKK
jgi:signal transduction histidine kinase/ligand-binding sensor domain-containing protein/DNA-binding response OmpR family regulator